MVWTTLVLGFLSAIERLLEWRAERSARRAAARKETIRLRRLGRLKKALAARRRAERAWRRDGGAPPDGGAHRLRDGADNRQKRRQ